MNDTTRLVARPGSFEADCFVAAMSNLLNRLQCRRQKLHPVFEWRRRRQLEHLIGEVSKDLAEAKRVLLKSNNEVCGVQEKTK